MKKGKADYFRENLDRLIGWHYKTNRAFIEAVSGLDERTFYRKKSDPLELNMSDIIIWSQALRMKPSEFIDMYCEGKLWERK